MDDGSIEGRADRIIRRLINEGDVEQVIDILTALIGNDGHDISIAFRAGLISQGFEADALHANEVKLFFHKNGFMLQVDPRGDEDWFENKSPELDQAFNNALVWIMRGANIDAFIDDDGRIGARGPILTTTGEEVEHLVGQFKQEIDQQFPDTPPQRQGKWW